MAALRHSGRRLLLVTGRELEDLRHVAPDLSQFDAVVAENGAVLFDPASQNLRVLAEPLAPALIDTLKRRGVPFGVGHAILATSVPHDLAVLAAIRDLGLERQLIYNKGAVMVLPTGVSKASGLQAALDHLGLSPHNVAGIGDAENDHAFLQLCEVAAAVGNALPAIKARADIILRRPDGRGVSTFIMEHLLRDLADRPELFARYTVEIGTQPHGIPLRMPVYGDLPLIVGPSGSGKSTLTGVLVERLVEQGYQVCVVDPEGDHLGLDPLVVLGSTVAPPTLEEVTTALERSDAGAVVNLVALRLPEKARFAVDLLAAVVAARATQGRPHWLVLDEAHHIFPADGGPGAAVLPAELEGVCFVAVEADQLGRAVLERVTRLYVVGADAGAQVDRFAAVRGLDMPSVAHDTWTLLEGEALLTRVAGSALSRPQRFRVAPRRTEHRRHVRKYAGGDLGDSSFYFRGPERRLNLRAFNVQAFIAMALGVDEATWQYHLANGDIARWFRERVKDPDLADRIAAIAAQAEQLSPAQSREAAVRQIEARYSSVS
ncbi:MAG TPA: HAD-IIB family hydrolase, partial [Dehalococcoidia bacterium]|jgi:hypothetical protein